MDNTLIKSIKKCLIPIFYDDVIGLVANYSSDDTIFIIDTRKTSNEIEYIKGGHYKKYVIGQIKKYELCNGKKVNFIIGCQQSEFVINWGDGCIENYSPSDYYTCSHTYSEEKQFVVTVIGKLDTFHISQSFNLVKIINISESVTKYSDICKMQCFNYCPNLKRISSSILKRVKEFYSNSSKN